MTKNRAKLAYVNNGVSGSKREEVGAGDYTFAGGFQFLLDSVDNVEPFEIEVDLRVLFGFACVGGIQQQRSIAALQIAHVIPRIDILIQPASHI